MKASNRCLNLRSPIRDLIKDARKLRASGMKIYPFNIGDPNKFDFDTPEHLKNALKEALDKGAGYYSDSEGEPQLREAICRYENGKSGTKLAADDVIVSMGISELFYFLFNAIIEPGKGDELLVPGPAYANYIQLTQFAGGVPVTYRLDEGNEWQTDVQDLRKKITKKTKAICIISPNNPTGSVLDRKTVKQMVDIAGEHKLPIISDEIYDRLVFDCEHTPTAKLAKDVPVITLNGYSKVYLCPGWRVGYAAFNDVGGQLPEIAEAVRAQGRQRLSPVTPLQLACVKAYDSDKHIHETVRKLKERAKFAAKKLNGIEGISTVEPRGSFYIFPKVELGNRWKDDEQFVRDVLKNTGLILPWGSGFDPVYGASHFRSVILPPIDLLDEAFTKLQKFMEK